MASKSSIATRKTVVKEFNRIGLIDLEISGDMLFIFHQKVVKSWIKAYPTIWMEINNPFGLKHFINNCDDKAIRRKASIRLFRIM